MNQELTKTIPCPSCGSTEYKVVRKARYPKNMTKELLLKVYHSSSDCELWDQLVTCKKCTLTYLNPRIDESVVLESYSSAEDDKFATQNTFRIKTFSKSLSKILKHIGKEPKGLKVLDIGSAAGAFLKAAKDMGCEATGVEPSKKMCAWAKEHYQVDLRPGTLEDQSFPEASFDLITLWDVLEHLYHPEQVLRECKRLLKKEGVLVVNFPDYDSLTCKLLKEKWPFFLNVHLIYFTPKSLKGMLSKTGFNLFYKTPYWQTLSFGYVCERASRYFSPFKQVKTLASKIGVDSLPLKYQMGQTLALASHTA